MISLSLSNLIKNFLNIQDDNILFQKKNIIKLLKKGIIELKFLKDFLSLITTLVLIVILKILLKMAQDIVKLNIFLFKITILNLSLLYKDIFVRNCKKTFSPSTNIVSDNSNISNNLKYTIALELKENVSLTYIAKKYDISVASVQRVMNICYPDFKVNKEHLPEAICIDEFKSVKNIDGAMSFVFADYHSKNIIDIVEDRRL